MLGSTNGAGVTIYGRFLTFMTAPEPVVASNTWLDVSVVSPLPPFTFIVIVVSEVSTIGISLPNT